MVEVSGVEEFPRDWTKEVWHHELQTADPTARQIVRDGGSN